LVSGSCRGVPRMLIVSSAKLAGLIESHGFAQQRELLCPFFFNDGGEAAERLEWWGEPLKRLVTHYASMFPDVCKSVRRRRERISRQRRAVARATHTLPRKARRRYDAAPASWVGSGAHQATSSRFGRFVGGFSPDFFLGGRM
jgi:hypothetical protein